MADDATVTKSGKDDWNDYWNHDNPQGDDKYQQAVDTSPRLDDPSKRGEPGDTSDRYAGGKGGNVFSWDEDANDGKGAWGVSGKVKDGKDPSDPSFNPETDVNWYNDADYDKASAIQY